MSLQNISYINRNKVWDGLGTSVDEAMTAEEAIKKANLDWYVEPQDIYTAEGRKIKNMKANVRSSDGAVLGVTSSSYVPLQNDEAFAFTDALIDEADVRYEAAGCTSNGLVFLTAKLPSKYIINGDCVTPYLLFLNSFNGKSSIRCAMVPTRVVCQNMINLALSKAKRSWGIRHVGDIKSKLHEARETLCLAETYMEELGRSMNELDKIRLSDAKVKSFAEELFPVTADMSDLQIQNMLKQQDELKQRYYESPDLQHIGKNGYRFINAIADMTQHGKPLRETKNYRENVFRKSIEGHPLVDRSYNMILAAA